MDKSIIKDCFVEDVGGDGIHVVGMEVEISGTIIRKTGLNGIYIEPRKDFYLQGSKKAFYQNVEFLLKIINDSSVSNSQKEELFSEIIDLVKISSRQLTPVSSEVANSKIDALTQVISVSADMVGLGMPIITMLQTFFRGTGIN
jgi:hypothetical protein